MTDHRSVLTSEKYVVMTTTKKNGDTVPTAVWIAPLADGGFGFTTDLDSGKVKRIRNFPDVTLQPSNIRGQVKPGAPVIAARASVLVGDDVKPVEQAIRKKYGFAARLIGLGAAIQGLFGKSADERHAAVRLELTDEG